MSQRSVRALLACCLIAFAALPGACGGGEESVDRVDGGGGGGGGGAGGGGGGGDTVSPTVTITSPTTNPVYAAPTATLNLSGTASDNVGVTQVTWSNNRGGSGIALGTTNWSITGIALQSGSNTITVTARDAAGNTSTDTLVANIGTFYLSTGGNNANDGLTPTTAWQTFSFAWSRLQPGNTLIVMNGNYTNASPPAGKSGSAGSVITVQAENDGGAVLDRLTLRGNAYLAFQGFRIAGTNNAVDVSSNGASSPSHDLTFQRIGFSCVTGTLNNGACFEISDGTTGLLLEDSWGMGGGRYTILCYGGSGGNTIRGCDNNTFRRVVLRQGSTMSSSGEPQASLSLYHASNNIVENVILIDGQASSDTSNSGFYVTGHTPPPNATNNKYYGVIALNNRGHGLYVDCDSGVSCNGVEIYNSVFWDSAQVGVVISNNGTSATCANAIIDHVTVGSSGSHGFQDFQCTSATLTNSAFYTNSGTGAKAETGNVTTAHHNGYFGNGGGARDKVPAGTGDLTSNPGFLFIARVEASSPYKNAGSVGDIGANVINRYQNGVLTATPLWPWPNEARLRTEMCAVVPTSAFCASGKTLTRYVWEYLGQPSPF